MKLYNSAMLNQGVGVLNHVLFTTGLHNGYFDRMPISIAIGVLAGAMRSGLTHDQIEEVIDQGFDFEIGGQLRDVLSTFKGLDIGHLWSPAHGGKYELAKPALNRLETRWDHSA